MNFSIFLNEANTKSIKQSDYYNIGKSAFGQLVRHHEDGADLSQVKVLLDKLSHKKIFDILVAAGKEFGYILVPTDGADSSGFVEDNGGSEDCIMLKIKGNDYSGDMLECDLVLSFDQLKIAQSLFK